MKVKALENLFLFDGTRITKNEIYDLEEWIAIDLEKGNHALIIKEIEEALEDTKKKPVKKKKGDE